jgi:hypothetical protein
MRRNIIITIEPDSVVGTTQLPVPASLLSVTELSEQVSIDSALPEKSKENHDDSAFNVGTPLQTDRWIYRIVVGALALALVSSIGGAVWLQSNDKAIPEILIGLGTGALGGLAGLLAPTPSKE